MEDRVIQLRPNTAAASALAEPSLRDELERWTTERDVDLALKIGTVTVGRLCIRGGEIRHAEVPGAEGDDAIRLLPRLVGTSLASSPLRPAPNTVTIDWRAVLEPKPRQAEPAEALPIAPTVVDPPADESFDALFRRATQAYVRRDRELARTLFRRCLDLQPEDKRARHNLEKLESLA